MNGNPGVLLVATMDTKGNEARYMESLLNEAGISVFVIDGGIMGETSHPVSVSSAEVARAAGAHIEEIRSLGHEGKAMALMVEGAVKCAQRLYNEKKIQGVIGLGGSMGTTLGTGVMRSFPVGLPKVMISTMASRNTRPFVGTKDIMMLHAVSDLSGLNRITRQILKNGAMALAGMVKSAPLDSDSADPVIALSTLGTTEACAVRIRETLENEGYEVVIFHTVGAGGQAMEEMICEGKVDALMELSLHEIGDHLFGGDYDAGPDRGKAAPERGIPTIMVPGNVDFLVTGPLEQAQQVFPNRRYHAHNNAVTAVRASREEIKRLAQVIGERCNNAKGPLLIFVPLKGLSAFDRKEGPLHDPEAPQVFVDALRKALHDDHLLEALPYHVNDPEFSQYVGKAMLQLLNSLRQ